MMTNSELNSQQIKDDFLPLKILQNIYWLIDIKTVFIWFSCKRDLNNDHDL